MKKSIKKILALTLATTLFTTGLTACSSEGSKTGEAGELYVYNWGEYFDPDALAMFEDETGIKVTYDEYETNEVMYPIISNGAASYDLVCPSDYMVQRMISENLVEEINFDNVPNIKYVDTKYMDASKEFDPENKYSVPYLWGTVGILYNKTMVKEPVDSWGILWDTKYKDNILMQKSVRDAFGITLKYLGYSLNSTDEKQLEEAKQKLIEQKKSGVVQAYVVDEVRDKMINGAAAIGVIYSGEYLYCQEENEDLEYVIPKEGTNIWYDGWVITKGSENVENAHKWIDFLCSQEAAYDNFEYIYYGTPNIAAQELIDEDIINNPGVFPDEETIEKCEVYNYLGEEAEDMYYELWKKVK